jgi:hypothetical protein
VRLVGKPCMRESLPVRIHVSHYDRDGIDGWQWIGQQILHPAKMDDGT